MKKIEVKETLKIVVTQLHIDTGLPKRVGCCAIALSATEKIGVKVQVDTKKVGFDWFIFQRNKPKWKLPKEAVNFLTAFDCKDDANFKGSVWEEYLRPFEFEAEAV